MFMHNCKRLFVLLGKRAGLLAAALLLLGSLTLTAHAILTVSNSGLSGDGAVTVDGAGLLDLGTASSTGIVIGNSAAPVTIQGSSLNASGTSTLSNLLVTGHSSFGGAISDTDTAPFMTVGTTPLPTQWAGFTDGSIISSQFVGNALNYPNGLTVLLDGVDGNASYGIYALVQDDSGANNPVGIYTQSLSAGTSVSPELYGVWSVAGAYNGGSVGSAYDYYAVVGQDAHSAERSLL